MIHKITNYIALFFLTSMFLLMFFSILGDSATMDELAHIPSGYSYLSQQDYRLNPEHPPLMKNLSALPLMFLNLNFPTNVPAWTEMINGQWDMGRIFLYESGNNADQILLWSRLPIILLAILFGWMFFKWVNGLYGNKVALLALFFFTFSPTFLAHSRYVTTDLAAAFGFFIGIAYFVNFLQKNSTKSLLTAGLALGVAQLLKFSLVILAPLYILLGFLWVFLDNYRNFNFKKFAKEEFVMILKIALIGAVGLFVIFFVYLFNVWNYPVEKQISDATNILSTFRVRPLANFVIWLSGVPVLRSMGQYFLGVLMVIQRAAGGNTAYLLGEVTNVGWWYYFPVLYLLKEHLAFHILTLIALIFGLKNIYKNREKNLLNTWFDWMKENFAITASIIFISIYWLQAILSPLNIGVRHVLPTFPFIYLLVSKEIILWIKKYSPETPKNLLDYAREFYKLYIKPLKKSAVLLLLLFWMFLSSVLSFPNYLSYYNELAGGTNNGYKTAVDSNYDWGQDLKRLKDFIEENNIEKMGISYFGGGNPEYYLGEKFEPWWPTKGIPSQDTPRWLAVSATFLQEARGVTVKGFERKREDTFWWLVDIEPTARAGKSIFIYRF